MHGWDFLSVCLPRLTNNATTGTLPTSRLGSAQDPARRHGDASNGVGTRKCQQGCRCWSAIEAAESVETTLLHKGTMLKKLKFNPDTPLYASDERAWALSDTAAALDATYARGKPVVIFVHGRGKEPEKSLRGGRFVKGLAVHKIERGYDVSVLMFNWDSAFPGFLVYDRTAALKGAQNALPAFATFLEHLGAYLSKHPGYAKPALLVHSMGSIVLQHTLEASKWQAGRLFAYAVLSEPDADDIDHANWLTALGNLETTFITMNRDDRVLQRSTDDRPPGARALGLDTDQPLAVNVKYIDLTNMGPLGAKDDDHEVFGKGAMNGQIYACQFFTQAIRGEPVELDTATNVESVSRGVVYKLKSRTDPGAACLVPPDLTQFERDAPYGNEF